MSGSRLDSLAWYNGLPVSLDFKFACQNCMVLRSEVYLLVRIYCQSSQALAGRLADIRIQTVGQPFYFYKASAEASHKK